MGNSHKNLLLRNHWANCNQTFVEWSLDGPLPKLCPVIPTSNQDKKNLLWNYWANLNQTLLKWSLGGPLSNCVRQRCPVSKMATITKNRNFLKWPKLLYFKPILVGVLKCRTQFWKRTTQETFQQSLVEIGSVVSEEKIFFKFHPPFFLICIIGQKG
jgi:hypothetical protein